MTLYDWIGHCYDSTRRADPYLTERLATHLSPRADRRYVDLACGTGNYSIALADRGIAVVGLDLSSTMINVASRKARGLPWIVADVAQIPFPANTFAGAICVLALHHFDNLEAALADAARVLCKRGRLVLLTATPDRIVHYWLRIYFPEMIERSAAQMPSLARVRRALRAAGFKTVRTEPYSVRPDLLDLFLYSGKHRPEIYLDPSIRAGISSFATLTTSAELQAGCARLSRDIETGAIDAALRAADRPDGDYLFLIAERWHSLA